jgi:hypothetical protein
MSHPTAGLGFLGIEALPIHPVKRELLCGFAALDLFAATISLSPSDPFAIVVSYGSRVGFITGA